MYLMEGKGTQNNWKKEKITTIVPVLDHKGPNSGKCSLKKS